ncbi:glycosyltransferase [Burkholderia catarinensis]|uniref:glycosyltransferase n=1 Tax=Burkholderia catarinensis TaxID=1108140 RepID=UPI00091FD694|nr:glycosyltransferase [Burkholderia catarinensis]KAG8150525.1 glycosyl transferase family 2 [Burkholderia catarinensis]
MPFVSYAQNFEDVMLYRALQHIKDGFYIDVGAWSPDQNSVTRAFSDRGWRGINVEPDPFYFSLLRSKRLRDVNLQMRVGENIEPAKMAVGFDSEPSPLDEEIARGHVPSGRQAQVLEGGLTTLNVIWREYVGVGQVVHFLKIDASGDERNVIVGNDWTRNRPWVVVAKAMAPLSQVESHCEWEPILLAANYSHVYSDGLNRYYVAGEHRELFDAFKYPPNVFDEFVSAGSTELNTEAAEPLLRREASRPSAQTEPSPFDARLELDESNLIPTADDSRPDDSVSGEISRQNRRLKYQVAVAESRGVEAEYRYTRQNRIAKRQISELRTTLAGRDALIQRANLRAEAAEQQYEAVTQSMLWRIVSPARRVGALVPSTARVYARRTLKAMWWTVTPWKMRARLEFMRQRRATQGYAKTIVSEPIADLQGLKTPGAAATGQYAEWIKNIEVRTSDVDLTKGTKPLVSFLFTGVDSTEELIRTVGSIRAQSQQGWEIIVSRAALDTSVVKSFEDWAVVDTRMILVGESSEKLERSTGLVAAFDHAQGEYVAVLDGGDMLSFNALNEIAATLRDFSQADIIYGDEDMQSAAQSRERPYFKPSWSPDLLYAFNYFGRLTLLRRSLVQMVGGIDVTAGAAVEWDINLRVSDVAQSIIRVPKVLCHRKHGVEQDRPAPGTREASDHRVVIQRYWKRNGINGEVTVATQSNGTQHATWEIERPPLVSVIIPTKNKPELLRMCVDGLLHATDYSNKEVIIVDTGSDDPETLEYYRFLKSEPQIRIVYYRNKFNYSAACNFGASRARGEFLLFLNNDIEIITRDWLQELVRLAMRPGVGVVGTKLVYPSRELQHAGVSIGIHLAALMYRGGQDEGWGVFGSPEHPRNWLAIMGACQLVRRSVFEEVYGFDESYLIAMSDVALCLQAWRAGYRIAYTPYACLVHHEGATRGSSNPAEDVRRLADDIRHFGIDEDPYLHPELDGRLAIPALRLDDASVRTTLERHLVETGSLPLSTGELRLEDEGVCMAIVDLPRDSVLWQPQAAHKILDIDSAARWCLDLLRRRDDLRVRFPRALSDGGDGEFADWLLGNGERELGLTADGLQSIKRLFAEDFGAAARQAFMQHEIRTFLPHGLTPAGSTDLFEWFIRHGRVAAGLRLEQIWWLFWQASEDPVRELVEAYRFTPAWQRLHSDGLTIFGRAAFAAWFAAKYRVHDHWVVPETWSVDLSPAEQIRIAYNAREDWRERFPAALRDVDAARALIHWLQADEAPLPSGARAWCKSLDTLAVAKALAKPGVNVIGHFCYPSGLRVSVEALVKGMQEAGVQTSLRDLRTDRKDDPYHVNFFGTEDFDVTIIHTQPEPFFSSAFELSDLLERAQRTYRIAYWYWEFDSVPDSWTAHASGVDEVWTATEFVAQGLRNRLSIPVKTIFPGVQLGEYRRRDRSYFGLKDDEYTFLFTFHMMSVMERKNPMGLIRAFSEAFRPDDSVCLVLKTSFGDRHPVQLEELRLAAKNAGVNIKIIDQVYTADEVLSLMDACDAYVSLHRSEGLGLTMAEAMLMGKPVIATSYSGNVDFMDETNSLLVPYELVKLGRPIPPYDANQHWAEPSVKDAANLMRKVFENQEWAKELGARARVSAERKLSLVAAGDRAANRIDEIRSTMLE